MQLVSRWNLAVQQTQCRVAITGLPTPASLEKLREPDRGEGSRVTKSQEERLLITDNGPLPGQQLLKCLPSGVSGLVWSSVC